MRSILSYKYFILLAILTFLSIVGFIHIICNFPKSDDKLSMLISESLQTIDIGTSIPDTHYVPDKDYFKYSDYAYIPEDYSTYTVFETSEVFGTSASFEESFDSASFSEVPSDANTVLYDLADKYYMVYFGSKRVSPIVPLALANVETGGRADFSKTWSALFPSRIVPMEYLTTMNVTTVIKDASYYNALSKEYSTRDRGALQMSPTYGTGNAYFNGLMSGTEVSKLSTVDTTNYTSWCSGASNSSGDRFYIPDVCLRLSAAHTQSIEFMMKNSYTPTNDMQLVVMLAMHHQQSAVWGCGDHSKTVGAWKSGELAFDYAKLISSQEFVNIVKDYVKSNPNKFYIDANEAKALFAKTGKDMSSYANKTVVATYPIKVIYAYIKLCTMYSK